MLDAYLPATTHPRRVTPPHQICEEPVFLLWSVFRTLLKQNPMRRTASARHTTGCGGLSKSSVWSVNGQCPAASHRHDRAHRNDGASEPLRLERLEALEHGLVVLRRPPKAGVVRSNRIGGASFIAGQTGWISGGYDRSRSVDGQCGQ